jgi:hypothetical protein
MTQEKLDLLKFSTVGMAQLGASAAKIVRRYVLKAQTHCAFAHIVPASNSRLSRPESAAS